MNYRKIYESLIARARSRHSDTLDYSEKHHIIPRCLDGSDDPSNLVDLTAREHYVAHWLLVKIYPSYKLAAAFHMMCSASSNQRREISSRQFETARVAFAKFHPAKNEDIRNKISTSLKRYYSLNPKQSVKIEKKCECSCGKAFFVNPCETRRFYSHSCSLRVRDSAVYGRVSDTLKKTLSELSEKQMKDRMKNSVGKCDHTQRGNSISSAKRGRRTNQQKIMGLKYAAMNNDEFEIFISNKSDGVKKRMKNLRNRFL